MTWREKEIPVDMLVDWLNQYKFRPGTFHLIPTDGDKVKVIYAEEAR